jgi:hypothetical protein
VDIDDDDDNDLLFGAWTAYPQGLAFVFYENIGSPEHPEFSFVTENYQDIASLWISMIIPRMVDVDLDADFDLLLLEPSTGLWWFFENVGTPQQAELDSITNDFLGLGSDIEIGFYVDGGDIDDDGDVDVFGGTGYGGLFFFRNVTGQNEVGPRRPDIPYPKLDFSIGPNPANPVTWISFSLPAPQEATVAVYNILGAKVTTLTSGLQMPGTHNYIWNASQYSSGLYIIRLETPQSTSSQRVMVVK